MVVQNSFLAQPQFPSLLQNALGMQGTSASPFGIGGGFPPVGSSSGFTVGSNPLQGLGFTSSQFPTATNINSIFPAGVGVQPQLFSNTPVSPFGTTGLTGLSGLSGASPTGGVQSLNQAFSMLQQPLSATSIGGLAPVTSASQSFAAPQLSTSAQSQGNSDQQLLQSAAQTMLMLFSVLGQLLKPQIDAENAAAKTSTPAATTPTAAPLAATAAPLAGTATNITNKSAGTAAGSQLDKSLAAIATDPDGAKLLAAAKAKGVTIEVGDPGAAGGAFDQTSAVCNCPLCQSVAADGTTVVNGVTLSNSNGQTKVIVRDPNNIKTIVHELVHAVSTGDDNSKDEEGIADVVGSRVANHLGGAAVGGLGGTDQQIFINKQQFYPELNQRNAIRNTLAGLGISVGV